MKLSGIDHGIWIISATTMGKKIFAATGWIRCWKKSKEDNDHGSEAAGRIISGPIDSSAPTFI